MRLKISINAAGDMRLQTLADKPDIRDFKGCESTPLVCSAQVQELTRSNPSAERSGFGKLATRAGFSKVARRLIREAGGIVDTQAKSRVIFLTGTLPGSTREAVSALAAWSGWAVQTVKQWVRDFAPGSLYFGVWEYQRRGALHLHLCIAAPTTVAARQLKQRWKNRWLRILDAISRRSKVDLYGRENGDTWATRKWVTRTDAQSVEKSVAKYLSKYLSKGSAATRSGCAIPPSSWYFLSKSLRLEIARCRKTLELCRLSSSASLRLFERLAGVVAEQESLAFLYRSPADYLQKGLIALLKPLEASMLFERITELLLPLLHESGSLCVIPKVYIPDVCTLFAGRVLPDTT